MSSIEQAIADHDQAELALERGDTDEALRLATSARDTFAAIDGSTHPDVANVEITLAAIHTVLRDLEQAEEHARRATEIMVPRGRSKNRDLVRLCVNALMSLANVRSTAGDYRDALKIARRALKYAERLDPQDLSPALNLIGVQCKWLGRFDEAEASYTRARALAVGDVLAIATIDHNLCGLEHARGTFAAGIEPGERAVRARQEILGPDHPSVAADLACLAGCLEGAGQLDAAERAYRRALEVFEARYGAVNYEVMVNRACLAAVREARGDRSEAEALYLDALQMGRDLLAPDHPDLAFALNNLGVFYLGSDDPSRARPLLTEAFAIFRERLGAAHPSTKACAANLDECP